ncbi:hypothetical protein VTN49DRAFT_8081 [Thermomyces lanuginosus]|uniref:uncharacterized protein n=1 Tax=Thermomyces lanuginosus TaxID=5541 RepID=UPI00374465E3
MITMTQANMREYACILNFENESSLLLSSPSPSSSRCSSLEAPEKLSDRVLSHFLLPRNVDDCQSTGTTIMTECFSADEPCVYQPSAADDNTSVHRGTGCYATPASPDDDHATLPDGIDNINHEQRLDNHDEHHQSDDTKNLESEEQHPDNEETEQQPPTTTSSRGDDDDEEQQATAPPPRCKCEYVSECSLNAGDANAPLRKCVSHIFGRNKSCTRIIPDHLWVWYCRKHYQRVKYRQGDWVMKQCELIMETLRRLREWNGVESYRIRRRKREQKRQLKLLEQANSDHSHADHPTTTTTTITTRDEASNNKNINHNNNNKKPKRSPVNKPSPIESEKIQQFLDQTLTLDETDAFVHMIYEDLKEKIKHDQETYRQEDGDRKKRRDAKQRLREVTFPDLEILPNFKPSVVGAARANVDGAAKNDNGKLARVSKKGGVKKLTT